MRRIKRMMAVLMLAAVATISAQTAFAGVILSDKDGVIVGDKDGVLVGDRQNTKDLEAWGLVVVVVNGLTGVILSDVH